MQANQYEHIKTYKGEIPRHSYTYVRILSIERTPFP